MFFGAPKATTEVFGVSTEVLAESYIDRGELDRRIDILLQRDTHVALRGESKCGKTWFRKKNIPDAIVVQCRLNKTSRDLYEDILSQLGLHIISEESKENAYKGSLEATTEVGSKIIAKLSAKFAKETTDKLTIKSVPIGKNKDDLKFISDVINASGRRLVIEDFHYLSLSERKSFAFDMKALWEYRTFIVVIGIWVENNLLLHLNSDLAGRIEEISIYWKQNDLHAVLQKGSKALGVKISQTICNRLVEDSFGTVGILQKLALATLDEHGIYKSGAGEQNVDDENKYESAALQYAEQLNALYQTFASRVAGGIRQRKNSTGIYAHMLSVVMATDDAKLAAGLTTDEIFKLSHAREPRIQKPNLRQILLKIDIIQIDEEGRGLILSYDENKDEVFVTDKQLFLYRKYATAQWPWERLIEQATGSETGFEGD